MQTNMKFGMLQTVYTGEEHLEQVEEIVVVDNKEVVKIKQVAHFNPAKCHDELCGRAIQHEEPCFIDTWTANGDIFCDACGKCIRYERKMADRRGEIDDIKSSLK